MRLTRRGFVKGAAAGGAMFALPRLVRAQGSGSSYSVAVLGDTHYDGATVATYHPGDNPSSLYGSTHYEEFLRDIEMWHTSGRCPRLVAAGAALAEASPTSFVLQLGDLVQGDCTNAETHKQMLDAGIAALRGGEGRFRPGLPLLTVLGNHDERDYIRRNVARTAYYEWAGPYMRNEIAALTGTTLASDPQYPVFSFRYGGDLWVFCKLGQSGDSTASWCAAVKSAIEADVSARHVFLVTHGPFTPSATTSYPHWRLGGDSSAGVSQQGKDLYETLSRRHAVVISGHTHTTNWYWHENEYGGFAEMTVNSVWSAERQATAVPSHNSPEDYKASSNANQAYVKAMNFFRPGLKNYFYNAGAGHYRLNVSATEVTMEFYPGAATTPGCVFTLRKRERGTGWVDERALVTGTTGDWSQSVDYDSESGKASITGERTFTPEKPSAGNLVTLTVKMQFTEMAKTVDAPEGVQAAVQLGAGGSFQVWTKGNVANVEMLPISNSNYQSGSTKAIVGKLKTGNIGTGNNGNTGNIPMWVDVEADGVVPRAGVEYTFRFRIDYRTRLYTVSVQNAGGGFTPLGANGETSFALASDATRLSSVRFKGGGALTSIKGDYAKGLGLVIR